jgi:hypothetical protein
MNRKARGFTFIGACLVLCGRLAMAADATPDLSGFWELRYDSRSVPPAQLTAAAVAATRKHQLQDAEGLRWCKQAGLPLVMDSLLNVRQGTREVVLVSPMVSPARHIYIDGRRQIDPADYETTTVGNTVGHWEGDTLVAETIGLSNRGIVSIPGGGFRTSDSKLTERYRLAAGGRDLYVTFTWTDAKVFARPHTYEFHYYRLPDSTNIKEWPCDYNSEERARFFAPVLEALKGK